MEGIPTRLMRLGLCHANLELMLLVRYIHLNPLRAKLVKDLKALEKYSFSGHRVILGKLKNSWQDVEYVLNFITLRGHIRPLTI